MNQHPYDFAEARTQANAASERTRLAEDFYKQQARAYAIAEEAYRKRLAERIVELRGESKPVTIVPDLARGDTEVARLKRERDIAEGMKDAALQALWRLAADRRDLGRFIDWSMRAAFRDDEPREQDYEPVIGGR
jgi:hypothetical protein